MKFKLLAVAAVAALSTNAMAATDAWDFVEELVEEVMSDPFGPSEEFYIDIDDNDGSTITNNFNFDQPALDASVLSAAINVEEINGSVSITGRDVSVSAGAADVSATATANALDSVAKASAIVGTDITTLAAGAINSSSVDVSGYQYGEDIAMVQTDGYEFGEDTFEIDVPYTAVFHGAVNAAAINASVTIAASSVDGIYHTAGGALSLSNLAINTTALGAVNSGVVRIGADLIEAAKIVPTVAP